VAAATTRDTGGRVEPGRNSPASRSLSLRARLNVLITALFVIVFLGAGAFQLTSARNAVRVEMESTAHLAVQLIESILAGAAEDDEVELQSYLVDRLSLLRPTRHLQVFVHVGVSTEAAPPPGMHLPVRAAAPDWFVRLVQPPPMEFRRAFTGTRYPHTEILVRANPSDEISEAWRETRNLMVSLLLFIVLANVIVFVTLGRALAPIDSILSGLERIEHGDYRLKLAASGIPELRRISEKFNHVADVLQQSHDENRRLTRRLLEIQEDERRHLARELHDELGQSLSAIKAHAFSIGQAADPAAVRGGAATVAEICERTYRVTRAMMQRLRPAVLDELGLHTALQELVDNWNAGNPDTFCRLDCRAPLPALSDAVSTTVFRIVQEALTNVVRHAGAVSVLARVDAVPGPDGRPWLEIEVRDDGRGFDSGRIPRGLGLLGMRERVEGLDGEFAVVAAPGAGVRISARVPCESQPPAELAP
jgi:two-component system sensor histidine kinase UhpB